MCVLQHKNKHQTGLLEYNCCKWIHTHSCQHTHAHTHTHTRSRLVLALFHNVLCACLPDWPITLVEKKDKGHSEVTMGDETSSACMDSNHLLQLVRFPCVYVWVFFPSFHYQHRVTDGALALKKGNVILYGSKTPRKTLLSFPCCAGEKKRFVSGHRVAV